MPNARVLAVAAACALLAGAAPPVQATSVQATTAQAAHVGHAAQAAQAAPVPPGWRPAYRADFSGGSLPRTCGSYGGPHGGEAASWYDPKQIRVSGGLLHLGIQRKSSGDRTYATGGVGCWSLARTYGKFDIRAKVPHGKGMDSYLVLWPEKENSRGGEGDWSGMELLTPGTERVYVTNGYGSGVSRTDTARRLSDGFHTYTFEWAPHWSRMLIDGQVVYRGTRAFTGRRWLGLALSSGDALTGVPNANTRIPNEFAIDWFAISAYVPGKPKAKRTPRHKRTPTPTPSVADSGSAVALPVLPGPNTAQPVREEHLPWAIPAALGGALAAAALGLGLWYGRRRRPASRHHK
ncbi:MAG TPA: family 16 glycosylhydrolase [Streptosporangiaceae bacterium]|jgi:beta-glucanase (GH16 family)